MSEARTHRYTSVAIALHWAMALLLVGMVFSGWYMGDLKDSVLSNKALIGAIGYSGPNEAALQVMSTRVEWMYQLHKSIGITILLLALVRIIWRIMNPPPKADPHMKPLEKTASHLVHLGFYGLMITIPLLGWAMVSVPHDFQVPTVLFGVVSWPKLPFIGGWEGVYGTLYWLHGKMGWLLFGLLALHVLGALKHEFSSEEGVLKRMIPGLFGKTDGARAPSKGFLAAFGSAAVLFALVAGSPIVASAMQGGGDLQTTGTTGIAPNWDVDYEVSDITFSGTHDGNDFSGTFETWQAQVAFFPENLEASEVRVEVDLASAKTGTKLYDDSLKAAEWFDVKASAQASVLIDNFRADLGRTIEKGTPFIADATLTLKGNSVMVPLVFTLIEDGSVATLDAEAIFTRQALDLGQQSDSSADWVSEDVTVRVSGKATRDNGL